MSKDCCPLMIQSVSLYTNMVSWICNRYAELLGIVYLPITRRQILDSSKLKEFADDHFKFDENGRKLSKWVENTVGKGKIARFPGASKCVIVWDWV